MALSLINTLASNQSPGGTVLNKDFNNSGGTDNYLFVAVTHSNNTHNVKYNNVAMILLGTTYFSGFQQRVAYWGLANPATGTNTIKITLGNSSWNKISLFAASFTGCSGAGGYVGSGGSSTPNEKTLTIATNSRIYASGMSNGAQSNGYIIGNTSPANVRAHLFSHNTNKIVKAALSPSLPGGITDVITRSNSTNISNVRIEIQEAASSGGDSEGNFFLCM